MEHRPIPEITASVILRLWQGIVLESQRECWPWKRYKDRGGYGMIQIDGEPWRVSRVLWKHWYGFDPGELEVCHNCNNPPCCNPNHLFCGSHSDNMQHAWDCGRRVNLPTKLSNELIAEIRNSKESGTALAIKYGVCSQHVNLLRRTNASFK